MGAHPFDGWLRDWRPSTLGHYFAGEGVSDSADLAHYDLGRNVLRTPRGVAMFSQDNKKPALGGHWEGSAAVAAL